MAERDALLAEFQNITGCDPERAQFFLESANMQLDLAISSFYENDGQEPGQQDASFGGDDVVVIPPQEGMDVAEAGAGAGGGGGGTAGGSGAGKGKINMGGMEASSDSSDEEEGQAFYAGGSSSSGNVILGPGKKKKDIVGNMFKAAREAGAEEVDPRDMPGGSQNKVKAFSGGGFKLGDESSPSVAVGGPSQGAGAAAQTRHFTLKMWQNGFSVDDGELREYTNPENRDFLASVMKGTIPPELVKEAKGGEVHVDMEDHRNEEFVKPKASLKPFQGSGQMLGSIAPQVTAPAPQSSADQAALAAQAKEKVAVNESEPTTSIQVRMADGSRLVVKLNHTHTVGDVRSYIATARPEYASVSFVLLTTFPPSELSDESKTLKEAGLLGAAILQRLK